MKQPYERASWKVISIEQTDIITTSPTIGGDEPGIMLPEDLF